jgi:hypothetical protein
MCEMPAAIHSAALPHARLTRSILGLFRLLWLGYPRGNPTAAALVPHRNQRIDEVDSQRNDANNDEYQK